MSSNWPQYNQSDKPSNNPTGQFPGQPGYTYQNPFSRPGNVQSQPFGQATPVPGTTPEYDQTALGGSCQKPAETPFTSNTNYHSVPQAFGDIGHSNSSVPPPFTKTVETPKVDTPQKSAKSSMPSHVYHENLTAVSPLVSPGFVPKSDDEMLETVKLMNKSTQFVYTTVASVPSTSVLLQKAQIPLGYIIRPLAPLTEGEPEIPVVNYGTESITRCTQCRTYINPYVKTDASRRYWICNLCDTSNELPLRYAHCSNDNYESLPPELNCAVMDYIASADYMVRPPQPPTIMFVIDVSASAVNSRMLEVVCKTISELINNDLLPGGPRTLVGIITYDTSIHFYQITKGASNLQVLTISDLEDLFLPLPSDILVNVSESSEDILRLLEVLPETWKNNNITGSCMGSAIRAAHFAMKNVGGKMCVFTASPSYYGDFSLNLTSNLDKKGLPNLQPIEKCKDYSSMVCQTQVSLELFVCTPQSVNLNSLYHFAAQTAGSIYYFPFKTHQDNFKLSEELKRVITRETCWESVMRVRVSKGWKVTNWHGNCFIRGSDLMVLPNCHSDHTFVIEFAHQETEGPKKVLYFQTAFLHTNSSGERRIRVYNTALPVSDDFNEVMLSTSPEVVLTMTAHLAISSGLNGKLYDARNLLQTTCGKIATSFTSLNPVPDALRLYIMYTLGLLKSSGFIENVTSDSRIFHWMRLRSLPIEDVIAYSYPRLIPVHDLSTDVNVAFPQSISLTHNSLTNDGAYLLENGESMMLWIGRCVSVQWLQSVFDVTSVDLLNCDLAESFLINQKNPTAIRLTSIIKLLRSKRPSYMNLRVVKQGDESEALFFSHLIHDKTQGMMVTLNDFYNSMVPRSPLHLQRPIHS